MLTKIGIFTLVLFFTQANAKEDFILSMDTIPFSLYQEKSCEGQQNCYYFRSRNPIEYHGRTGFEHIPSISFRESLRTEQKIIYDVIYEINAHGLRPSLAQGEEREKFALFFGGSFTFGQGIERIETLPSQFAKQNDSFESYNFGVSGSGINTMMAQITHYDLPNIVKQRKGIAVYIYFEEHIARALGNLPALPWLRTSPYYSMDDLTYLGSIEESRPWRTRLLLFLREYLPGIKHRIFPSIGAEEVEYGCRLFERARDNLKHRLGEVEFIVLQHPFYGRMRSELRSCLVSKGITVADSEIIEDLEYKIPYDGHPNLKANSYTSTILSKAIKSE